jgi:hypothetical protein
LRGELSLALAYVFICTFNLKYLKRWLKSKLTGIVMRIFNALLATVALVLTANLNPPELSSARYLAGQSVQSIS